MTQNLAVAQRNLQPFQSSYTVTSGDTAYNTSAKVAALVQANSTSGVYALVWQRTVPAQQVVRWGYGNPAFQLLVSQNWFASMDEGTLMHTTTNTNLGTAVPLQQNLTPLPEQTIVAAGEDSLLQLHFLTESATTTVDACNFSLGVTIYQ